MENKSKYKSLAEWRKSDIKAYRFALKYNFLDEISETFGWSLVRKSKPKGYWTKERCIVEALKYKTKADWGRGSLGSYSSARIKGWLEECTKHMVNKNIKPLNYWILEKCKEEALKYGKRVEWLKNNSPSYQSARKNKWLDECCEHMVGYKKSKPNGYWTKERCVEEALKYKTRNEWNLSDGASYQAAKVNGWFDECCIHINKHVWNLEQCKEEALKYKTKKEWRNGNSSSYSISGKNGWVNECTTHMVEIKKPNRYWTKERCIEDALKYNTKKEWRNGNSSSYSVSGTNKWVDECSTHMVEIKKPNRYWTKERCIEEALKYKTKKEWCNNSSGSYDAAISNKWNYECGAHMNSKIRKPHGYWSKERCIEEALKYKTRNSWKINGRSSYDISRYRGWSDECTAHM